MPTIAGITLEGIPGHVDALGELTLTGTESMDHVEVGIQHPFDPDDPEPLLIDSSSLVSSGFAGSAATRTGAYSADGVIRATLTTSPVAICSTGPQPHTGRWKVGTRVYASATEVYVRLNWRVGDGKFTPGPWRRVPGAANFYDVALDVINIAEVPSGTHSWEGYIEAYTDTPGTTLDVDFVDVFPAAVYALARVPLLLGTPVAFLDRDEFDQSAGNLNAKTSAGGKTWATSGDAVDLAVEATGHTVEREQDQDADIHSGRTAISGAAAATTQLVEISFKRSNHDSGVYHGLYARWADASNWFKAQISSNATSHLASLRLYYNVAGSVATLPGPQTFPELAINTWYRLSMLVTADGQVFVWLYQPGGERGDPIHQVQLSQLATGGALASGKPGFYDAQTSTAADRTRSYDDFLASTPAIDHALWSGQSAKLKHDSYQRENAAGTRYGKLPIEGQYLRIPPATRAGAKSRLAIKTRRFDVSGGLPSTGLGDSLTVDLTVVPRVLLTSGSQL